MESQAQLHVTLNFSPASAEDPVWSSAASALVPRSTARAMAGLAGCQFTVAVYSDVHGVPSLVVASFVP